MEDALIAELFRRARDPRRSSDEAALGQTAPGPLPESAISEVEERLGRALPRLLRRAYAEVGNGGFGPGYGLLPLVLDENTTHTETLVDVYVATCAADPEDPSWKWPTKLLPFCDWGCNTYSCIDCSSPGGAVVTFSPDQRTNGEPMSKALARTHEGLFQWFLDWTHGIKISELMFERDLAKKRTVINPFTKEPIQIIPRKLRR